MAAQSAPDAADVPAAFSLDGRRALVTGARGGIGRAIAVALAAAGAEVVLHGHHDDLDATAALVASAGALGGTWVQDLRDGAGVESGARELLDRGPVDVLVNNAATISRRPVEEIDFALWQRHFAVNVDAAWLLTRTLGAAMIDRGGGKVLMVGSLLSVQGGVDRAAYAASKHALLGMVRALSNEWAEHNVQVNALAPGYVATERPSPAIGDPALLARIPAGRWGTPADVAGPAVFLASRASDYVSGHLLAVDGGWLSR
ncbi:SDR family oxidoreductase [Nakamurella endophytica]|uniref:2-dehydro-3-deoxy-D-gluconate 5-dehydrogenase n=1 Tax=Nakamurella endophytica TaxID=1748367 RepID=A0A917WEA7_9ACTN|nr:SDR family oxidoreductase [Nakamurella endophytica]GGL94799.1 2-dehydro-3-deoxy-D-gluconate 5-dehydrogenase [Nakamurella endophytica]